MKAAREGAPGFTLLPRGAADAPPQTRLRFSGQHRDAAVLSGSWSPDALIESLRPCRNQRGGERGEAAEGGAGVGGQKTHIWHPRNPADSRKTSVRETYGPVREREARLAFSGSHGRQPPPGKKSLSEKNRRRDGGKNNNSPSGGESSGETGGHCAPRSVGQTKAG